MREKWAASAERCASSLTRSLCSCCRPGDPCPSCSTQKVMLSPAVVLPEKPSGHLFLASWKMFHDDGDKWKSTAKILILFLSTKKRREQANKFVHLPIRNGVVNNWKFQRNLCKWSSSWEAKKKWKTEPKLKRWQHRLHRWQQELFITSTVERNSCSHGPPLGDSVAVWVCRRSSGRPADVGCCPERSDHQLICIERSQLKPKTCEPSEFHLGAEMLWRGMCPTGSSADRCIIQTWAADSHAPILHETATLHRNSISSNSTANEIFLEILLILVDNIRIISFNSDFFLKNYFCKEIVEKWEKSIFELRPERGEKERGNIPIRRFILWVFSFFFILLRQQVHLHIGRWTNLSEREVEEWGGGRRIYSFRKKGVGWLIC